MRFMDLMLINNIFGIILTKAYMKNDIYNTQFEQGRLEDAGAFPRVVLIDTVSFCNLKCSMCIHKDMTRPKGVMNWNLFTRLVDEIAFENNATRVWMVFFGEPLILKRKKPSIFDMISYAKRKGLQDVVINTNANLLDEASALGILESGLNAVYIGIDAFSPKTYKKIRVGGDYIKTVNNVLNFIRTKKTGHFNKPEIFVQFVEMGLNKDEKDDFIRFWEKQGVTVKVRPMVSWAGRIEAQNLVLDNRDRWPCYWSMQTMSIIHTGRVVTCAVDLDAQFIAGDAREQTLKQIWNGKLKEIRNLQLAGKYDALPEICRNCKDWQSARADYYFQNYTCLES